MKTGKLLPGETSSDAVCVNRKTSGSQFLEEFEPPCSFRIDFRVKHAGIIGWQFNSLAIKPANIGPPQLSNEIAEFKDHVLTWPRLWRSCLLFLVEKCQAAASA